MYLQNSAVHLGASHLSALVCNSEHPRRRATVPLSSTLGWKPEAFMGEMDTSRGSAWHGLMFHFVPWGIILSLHLHSSSICAWLRNVSNVKKDHWKETNIAQNKIHFTIIHWQFFSLTALWLKYRSQYNSTYTLQRQVFIDSSVHNLVPVD